MARNVLTATFDAATELKDAGAMTASGAATIGGVPRVVNVGTGLINATLIVDVDQMETGGGQGYEIVLQASDSAAFTGTVRNVATIKVGGTTGAGVDRYTALAMNTVDGETMLPYLRVYMTATGATPSINFRAFLTKNVLNG